VDCVGDRKAGRVCKRRMGTEGPQVFSAFAEFSGNNQGKIGLTLPLLMSSFNLLLIKQKQILP